MESPEYHIPVLLGPSVDGLNICQHGVYVDVTLGGGGHSREILHRLSAKGRLFSFDQDADAIARSQREAEATQRANADALTMEADSTKSPTWTLIQSNFRYLKNWMRYYEVDGLNGVLADLGVSSHHFDDSQRGFSFRTDAPLDMRMNQQANLSAADIINSYDAAQLTSAFRLYGELRQASRLAESIVKARSRQEIRTTGELANLLTPLLGRDREKKDLARAFQALRIEVNHEMDALRDMLTAAVELLKPGGRLVVIAYHSLEDRIVKNLMRAGNIEGETVQDIYGRVQSPLVQVGKVIVPDDAEQAANPRSRSAKLRIAEKV